MPATGSPIHLKMLETSRAEGWTEGKPYGMIWGDPEEDPTLAMVRDRWCAPFVTPTSRIVEVGPGGGRWTRYLLGCHKLFAFDCHQELLDELAKRYHVAHLDCIRNAGNDLPGVEDESIDFCFSFGVFVHLELDTIADYLAEFYRVLKPGADAVVQFSDKSKPNAAKNTSFSDNSPSKMRRMAMDAGFLIVAENVTLLHNAAIMHLQKADFADEQVFSEA